MLLFKKGVLKCNRHLSKKYFKRHGKEKYEKEGQKKTADR
jgi:hypothetical protein